MADGWMIVFLCGHAWKYFLTDWLKFFPRRVLPIACNWLEGEFMGIVNSFEVASPQQGQSVSVCLEFPRARRLPNGIPSAWQNDVVSIPFMTS